jgi:hypothetical protein
LKGDRDYAVGSIETTVKDAAKTAKDSDLKSKLAGYRDYIVGSVETTAKDLAATLKHAREEVKDESTDLSDKMSSNHNHNFSLIKQGKKIEIKDKVNHDIHGLGDKVKSTGYKFENTVNKETHKIGDALHKGALQVEHGAQEAKSAIVHGAEVAVDKTKEVASDLAKKAEYAKVRISCAKK